MISYVRMSRFPRALLLATILGFAPGCTLFDDYLPGTPFTPDQPVAEVTLEGEIAIDRASGISDGCSNGDAVLWGTVRNTGDLDVDEVFITVDVFDASDHLLGSYRVNVFNGEVTPGTDENSVDSFSTNLLVDQAGVFEICAPLASETVARTDYRTDFIIIDVIEE